MLDLTSLKKSIQVLDDLLHELENIRFVSQLDKILQDGLRSGAIQNFEVAYEVSWKMLKRWLEQNLGSSYIDGVSRRELFRLARESLLINDVDVWMIYHRARNETSHTYDSLTADEVFEISKQFIIDAKKLLSVLESKND